MRYSLLFFDLLWFSVMCMALRLFDLLAFLPLPFVPIGTPNPVGEVANHLYSYRVRYYGLVQSQTAWDILGTPARLVYYANAKAYRISYYGFGRNPIGLWGPWSAAQLYGWVGRTAYGWGKSNPVWIDGVTPYSAI